MSIVCLLAQTRPTDAPVVATLLIVVLLTILVGMSVLSPWLVRRLSLLRPPAGGWPVRFGPGDTPWKFLILLMAIFVLSQAGAILIHPLLEFLPRGERVMVASVLGTAIGTLAVLPLNIALRADGMRILGLPLGGMVRGLCAGSAGYLIVIPWLFWLMIAQAQVLKWIMPEAPMMHELFRIWQQPETTNVFRGVAILTAVVIAPFFEELAFRGFLQTGIARLFARSRRPVIFPPAPIRVPPAAPGDPGASPPMRYLPTEPALTLTPSPAARWAAIITTAALFAAVHQPWTITIPIFALALGLGYVYERTGNLWSAIFLHMLFNGFQFAWFLFTVSR